MGLGSGTAPGGSKAGRQEVKELMSLITWGGCGCMGKREGIWGDCDAQLPEAVNEELRHGARDTGGSRMWLLCDGELPGAGGGA